MHIFYIIVTFTYMFLSVTLAGKALNDLKSEKFLLLLISYVNSAYKKLPVMILCITKWKYLTH